MKGKRGGKSGGGDGDLRVAGGVQKKQKGPQQQQQVHGVSGEATQ